MEQFGGFSSDQQSGATPPAQTTPQNFTPTSANAANPPIQVQVFLDSEMIQDRMYRRNLRSNS